MSTRHLPPERRREIARNAIMARHHPGPPTYCALTGLPLTNKRRAQRATKFPEIATPVANLVAQMRGKLPLHTFITLCGLIAKNGKLLHNNNADSLQVGGLRPEMDNVAGQHPPPPVQE